MKKVIFKIEGCNIEKRHKQFSFSKRGTSTFLIKDFQWRE